MIHKTRLEKYLAKRWKGMLESLSVLSTSPDPEAIHVLRLHAKKVKAIELLSDVHKQHYSAPLKPIIQQAGDIRAAELNLQTLKGHAYGNPALEQELQTSIDEGYLSMRRNKERYQATVNSVSRKWKDDVNAIREQQLIAFLMILVEELGAAFHSYVRESDLHENRKKIKHLLYAYVFLPKKLRDQVDVDERYLDNLQQQIGTWHDLEMALTLLEKKGLKHETVYSKIKKEQGELYEKIRREAKLFGKKVSIGKN
jgi:CHAD domain-containing protein